MDTPVEQPARSALTALTALLAALLALGLVRGALKAGGLLALTGVVAATVGVLTIGVLALRVLVL